MHGIYTVFVAMNLDTYINFCDLHNYVRGI